MKKINLEFSETFVIMLLRFFSVTSIIALTALDVFSQCPVPGNPGTITGTATACPGNVRAFSINAVTGATSYTWTLPAGCTISGQNPYTGTSTSVNVHFAAAFTPPGTISVTANNACGSSTPGSKLISGYYPPMSAMSGTTAACPNDNINYSVNAQTNVTYTWTVTPDITINSGQGTPVINASFTSTFASGTISVSGNSGCGNGPVRTKNVAAHAPARPGVISGSSTACPSATENYSVPSVAGIMYDWTAPAGATISGQGTANVSITFSSSFSHGTIYVRARTNCGTSAARTLSVSGKPAMPKPITGLASALCNSTQAYTILPVNNATSYVWIAPAGSTITGGQGTTSATISFPAVVTGYIKVKASNPCGTSGARKLAVTGNIIIAQHPQDALICQDDTTALSVNVPGAGLSYQWRKDGVPLTDNSDFSGTLTSGLSILKVDSLNAGNYDVIVSSSCAPSVTSSLAVFTVKMKPPEPGAIIAPPVACQGTSGVLSIPLSAYNTTGYFWYSTTSGVVITGGQGTDAIAVNYGNTGSSGYQFYCHGTNACGSSITAASHWIRRSVSTPQIWGSHYVCQGATNVSYTSMPVGATSYAWSVSTPDMSIASGQGTLNVFVNFSPSFTRGDLYLTATNPCMTTPPRIFKVYRDTSCRVAFNTLNSIGSEKEFEISSGYLSELSVYPNPAADHLNLEFTAREKNKYEIILTDVPGKNIHAETIMAAEGKNSIRLDLKQISSGLYVLKLKSPGAIYQQKIIINN